MFFEPLNGASSSHLLVMGMMSDPQAGCIVLMVAGQPVSFLPPTPPRAPPSQVDFMTPLFWKLVDLPLLNIAQLFWRDVKVSPILIVGLSPPPTLWAFLRRLRWNKVKNCYTSEIYTCTGGLIRFYIVIRSVLSQFKWPLLFLQHRGRGRRTSLTIRSQDPNNSSETDRGPCLKK